MLTCVPRQAWRTQPWKNGGGVTHEIARHDDAQGFVWRLSLAEVAQDGPFSRFDKVDRTIFLLEGAGFHLTTKDGGKTTLTTPFQPHAFAGEDEITCALVNGPVRDLNFMVRRDQLKARTQTHRTSFKLEKTDTAALIFVAKGSIKANDTTAHERDTLIIKNESVAVHAENATVLLLETLPYSGL